MPREPSPKTPRRRPTDETACLLSSPENARRLRESLRTSPEDLITVDLDELRRVVEQGDVEALARMARRGRSGA